MRSNLVLILAAFAVVAVGCGGSDRASPLEPSAADPPAPSMSPRDEATTVSNRYLWGLWRVRLSEDLQSVEVIPDRGTSLHFNCVRLLEVAPCSTCLTIENVRWLPDNIVSADLRIQHPFPGLLTYTGFDVRGIFISEGNYLFPESGRLAAHGIEVPQMLNPDGYTALFNPTEFPEGSTTFPALAYITGRYAPGGDLTATLNPYVAYGVDNPRRLFAAGSAETQTVQVFFPNLPLEFGYAVDASWFPVDVVVDPITDFPPEANCMEAYQIVVQGGEPITLTGTEPEQIFVEVFDHQGLETISSVSVESPALFDGEAPLGYLLQTSPESWLFSGYISNQLGAETGEYPLLVRIRDTWADGNLGRVDGWSITSAQAYQTPLLGWIRTWGDAGDEGGSGIAVDLNENVYVTGTITDGDGQNAYLAKHDPTEELLWERKWLVNGDNWPQNYGGTGGSDVECNSDSRVYVVGHFKGVVDLDPGPDSEWFSSNGEADVFLIEFTSSGDFVWALSFGGAYNETGFSLSIDSHGDLYVAGLFGGSVDFDPGPASDIHTSNGGRDVYLSKFHPTGEFQRCATWGGSASETAQIGTTVDANDNVYVSGLFRDTVDFDPGPDAARRTSEGDGDVFCSKFDSDGVFQWVRPWGGAGQDWCTSITVDGFGFLYLSGFYHDVVDFDPSPGEDYHTSNGGWDIFVSKISVSGDFAWAQTWGGDTTDQALQDTSHSVAVDSSGDVFLSGVYIGSNVDFDPGPGVDIRSSFGFRHAFLSKLDAATGEYVWAQTWGAAGKDNGWGIIISNTGNIYLTGLFADSVNFAPDDGLCSNSPDSRTSFGGFDGFVMKFQSNGCW